MAEGRELIRLAPEKDGFFKTVPFYPEEKAHIQMKNDFYSRIESALQKIAATVKGKLLSGTDMVSRVRVVYGQGVVVGQLLG